MLVVITATLAGQNEENAHIAKKTADEGRFIPELLSLMPLLIKQPLTQIY
jgi:hypothetical protein